MYTRVHIALHPVYDTYYIFLFYLLDACVLSRIVQERYIQRLYTWLCLQA